MNRSIPILILLAILALGSGAMERLHNLQHEHDNAQAAALARTAGEKPGPQPVHNDSNCLVHLQLHLPIFTAGWAPPLIFLGLFVAFLRLLAPRLSPQRVILAISCRGPPAI